MIARLVAGATLIAVPVRAEPALSYHRLYVRAGIVHMAPQSRSRPLELAGVHGAASLAVMDGPIAGSGVALDPITVPAVIVGYTLPVLDDRLSIETVLGAPPHVRFRATGTLADDSLAPYALGIPTGVPALGPTLGEADVAPPIVTLVGQIADVHGIRPYIGTGVGGLVAYNAHATNPILTEVAQPAMHVDPAFGWVAQAGVDIRVWRSLVARIDVKYIAFLSAHATVDDLQIRTPGIPLLGAAAVGRATMDVSVDPLIVQIGIGADL